MLLSTAYLQSTRATDSLYHPSTGPAKALSTKFGYLVIPSGHGYTTHRYMSRASAATTFTYDQAIGSPFLRTSGSTYVSSWAVLSCHNTVGSRTTVMVLNDGHSAIPLNFAITSGSHDCSSGQEQNNCTILRGNGKSLSLKQSCPRRLNGLMPLSTHFGFHET